MEKLNIKIRKAHMDDLAVLDTFQQEIIRFERTVTPTIKEGKVTYYNLEEMLKNKKANVMVAVINDEIVGSGYAMVKDSPHYRHPPQHAYLGFMYVLPEYRGNGIAGMLIQQLIAWAREMGLYEIQLDVYAGNDTAIKAYEKLGFTPDLLKMRLVAGD